MSVGRADRQQQQMIPDTAAHLRVKLCRRTVWTSLNKFADATQLDASAVFIGPRGVARISFFGGRETQVELQRDEVWEGDVPLPGESGSGKGGIFDFF